MNIPSIVSGVDFGEHHVMISGVSGAIGGRIARDFANAGAQVTGLDLDDPGSVAWRENGQYIEADVSVKSDVETAVKSSVNTFGEIDVLVNNAGINRLGKIEDITVEDWQAVVDVNLRGAFLLSKYALPSLQSSNGSIVNIASTAGLRGVPDYAAYAPTKAGLINLTKQMCRDYAREEIRVNAVAPGVIRAGMAEQELADPETAARKEEMTPMNRLGRPKDVSNVVLFVASEAASFITGAVMTTDGGVSA